MKKLLFLLLCSCSTPAPVDQTDLHNFICMINVRGRTYSFSRDIVARDPLDALHIAQMEFMEYHYIVCKYKEDLKKYEKKKIR